MDERARVWRRREGDPFQDNVVAEIEMFGGGSVMVWGCFNHDHKLDLVVVRRTLTGQRYIDDILSLLCTHISEHIKLHIPFFKTTMPVRIGPVLLQILLPRKASRNFSGRAGVPICIPSSTVGTVLDLTSTNEMTKSRSMILHVHLLTSGAIWSPICFEN